jgi:hypothetical protein
MVSRAVIKAIPVVIDDSDHIGGVLGDELEKLVALSQAMPNTLQLKMLLDRMEVEQENKSRQTTHPLLRISPVRRNIFRVVAVEAKKHNPGGQRKGDCDRESY